MRFRTRLLALGGMMLGSMSAAPVRAQESHVSGAELLPTFAPTGETAAGVTLRSPGPSDGELAARARELDALLGDTAQDLGLAVRIANRTDIAPSEALESRLLERAARSDHWLISPRLEYYGSNLIIRLVVVPPRSRVALVRVEQIAPSELTVRAVVMLRDLIRAGRERGAPIRGETSGEVASGVAAEHEHRARSEGRATLAVNAAIVGGFVGYALQKSSGSDDVRLTYPLLALGAGIGVGASLIVAEEWDIRLGDAWYLSAGAVWPTMGGLLLARGRNVEPESDRYAYGLVSGLGGITLASVGLTFRHISEAGAAVAHSGGVFGTGFGGATELAVRGTTKRTPYEGMGYGAIVGTVAGGLLGTQIQGSASRVFLIDVGAGLGALSAAAVASPLIFGDRTEGRDRIWIASTIAGALLGGGIVYFWTQGSPRPPDTKSSWTQHAMPYGGVIAHSIAPDGSLVPVLGVGCAGQF